VDNDRTNHRGGHEAVRALMHAVLDGDAAPGQRAELDAHLIGCDACRATFAELQAAEVTLIRAAEWMPLVGPRAGFLGRFQARLSQRERRPPSWLGALVLAGGALATVVVALVPVLFAIASWLPVAASPAALTVVAGTVETSSRLLGGLGNALLITARAVAALPVVWGIMLAAGAVVGAWLAVMGRLVAVRVTR
jgi:predicted anti-sigma-YlaC factor YlaD